MVLASFYFDISPCVGGAGPDCEPHFGGFPVSDFLADGSFSIGSALLCKSSFFGFLHYGDTLVSPSKFSFSTSAPAATPALLESIPSPENHPSRSARNP